MRLLRRDGYETEENLPIVTVDLFAMCMISLVMKGKFTFKNNLEELANEVKRVDKVTHDPKDEADIIAKFFELKRLYDFYKKVNDDSDVG